MQLKTDPTKVLYSKLKTNLLKINQQLISNQKQNKQNKQAPKRPTFLQDVKKINSILKKPHKKTYTHFSLKKNKVTI